ncbi:electron transport complex subunit RsxG [Chromatium okenii]|jgi:electron transport complex protein RnfG|uniref:Ion-translocating oxidoreductase complex subunit G n=1 Tax=Chromatium okenii TaxID=61644 RepID=A0A2S7XS35_9GAMM|nr:electron transport complex subunit RsxG [Chromatium okenii]PQJ96525.1 electron transport complex subunit RsxG [Chromatium okenii]
MTFHFNRENTTTHAIILGIFCLGFGIFLALTEWVTRDSIATRAMEDRQNSLGQVMPAEIHDNNPVLDTLMMQDDEGHDITVYRARKAGLVTGVAYETFGSGYAGQMKFMIGVDAEGRLLGVRVLSHKETPGLGDKIETKKGDWILQFTGLSLGNPPVEKWKVKKDGGQFDQFTGATITPRGTVKAIRRGLEFFDAHRAQLLEIN